MKLSTPTAINDNVYRLRDKIGLSTEPVFVPVRATGGRKLNDCFADVAKKVASHGGSIQYGWTVWECPGKLIEGEFHAIWAAPDGSFIDVTPKADGERRILFIPDQERVYQRFHIENVRLALTDDPAIQRIIQMNEEMGVLRRKYNDGTGESRIPIEEALAVQAKYSELPQAPIRTPEKVGRNDLCPCGSGKKFKRCHGQQT